MESKKLCNCSKYCGNPPKLVSATTYTRHANIRQNDALTPGFRALIASLSAQQPTAPIASKRTLPSKRTQPDNERPRKRQQQVQESLDQALEMDHPNDTVFFLHICIAIDLLI